MTLLTMYQIEEEEQSPTDTSEDSIEVRVKPVKITGSSTPGAKKNKRKSMEPKRLNTSMEIEEQCCTPVINDKRCRLNSTGSEEQSPPVSYNSESRSPSPTSSPTNKRNSSSPICLAPKKRFKFDALRDLEESQSEKRAVEASDSKNNPSSPVSPFRPWSESGSEDIKPVSFQASSPPFNNPQPNVPYVPFLLPGSSLPLSLPMDPRLYQYHLLQSQYLNLPSQMTAQHKSVKPKLASNESPSVNSSDLPYSAPEQDEPLSLVIKDKAKDILSPSKPKQIHVNDSPDKKCIPIPQNKLFNIKQEVNVEKTSLPIEYNLGTILERSPVKKPGTITPPIHRDRHDSGSTSSSCGDEKAKQRNYKNMTRERRVEANARERQRVHTITAAFDNLQAAIPTEEENVKLSKLSVIKIATAYIMALSRMAGHDYTEDQSAPSVEEVVQHCSEVIEAESKIKKRNNS